MNVKEPYLFCSQLFCLKTCEDNTEFLFLLYNIQLFCGNVISGFIHTWNWPLRSTRVYLYADEVPFDVHAHYHEGYFGNEEIRPCRSSSHSLAQVEIIQGHIHFIQIFLCIVPNFGGVGELVGREVTRAIFGGGRRVGYRFR